MMMFEEPLRVLKIFHKLNYKLMKPTKQEATSWILPSRPHDQTQPNVQVHPYLHTIKVYLIVEDFNKYDNMYDIYE